MSENQNQESNVQIITPNFTQEDFCMTERAFQWLYEFQSQPDEFTRMDIWLQNYAASKLKIGEQKYKTLKNLYIQKTSQDDGHQPNVTIFPDQPMELSCGKYTADKTGVSYISEKGAFVEVISHPIMPVKRYVNIDTNTEQIELAFRRGQNGWKNIPPIPKKVMSAASDIVVLANHGAGVTSENAKEVVKFLSCLENENFDVLPVQYSTSHLGWIGDRFIPYDNDLVFDTSSGNFTEMFNSVQAHGDYEEWKNVVRTKRTDDPVNLPGRIMLAASFASSLLEKFGLLPFWVHLSGDAGSGKTANLETAASVWGDPREGNWTQTLDTTKAGLEYLAGFAYSLPVCLDERQTVDDNKRTNLTEYVYSFCNKTGRNRAMKTGGLQKKNNWYNIAISTGEQGLTSWGAKAGSELRIIDLQFEPGERLFESGSEAAHYMNTIERNFGFAGREFIRKFQEDDFSQLEDRLTTLRTELEKSAAGKQASSGALLLLADELAERYIFRDGKVLSPQDMSKYLKSEEDVDMNVRIYQALTDWLVSNKAKFISGENGTVLPSPLLGKVDGNTYYVVPTRLDEFFQTYNFSEKLFLKWGYKTGAVIDHATEKDRHHTAQVRVGRDKYYWWDIRVGVLDHDGEETKQEETKQEDQVPEGYIQTNMSDDDLPW